MGAVPEWALRARSTWRYRGQERPPFAVVPLSGQESVRDCLRPPRIASDVREVIVRAHTRSRDPDAVCAYWKDANVSIHRARVWINALQRDDQTVEGRGTAERFEML